MFLVGFSEYIPIGSHLKLEISSNTPFNLIILVLSYCHPEQGRANVNLYSNSEELAKYTKVSCNEPTSTCSSISFSSSTQVKLTSGRITALLLTFPTSIVLSMAIAIDGGPALDIEDGRRLKDARVGIAE